MTCLQLASVTDWEGYSHAVRHLLAADVAPDAVRWQVAGVSEPGMFDAGEDTPRRPDDLPAAAALRLPRAFVEAARDVFLHADDGRHSLLHRMTARIAADLRAWDDPLHADRLHFDRMLNEVKREIHKMHAFVRFRPVAAGVIPASPGSASAADPIVHVAWFEPAHHVVERAADFFVRRYTTMCWTILTPRVSVRWDGVALHVFAGAHRADAPDADAGEALWLDYYRSIFNPARVKVAMMKKEMPVRFWKNLPEAATIGPLLEAATARQAGMVSAAADCSRRGATPAPDETPASAPQTLDALRHRVARCRDCPIADQVTQAVFGEGSPQARLMIVGEQPGDEEDLRGRPFQGPAGRLLREAFRTLGWNPDGLWLTNAVKHFHHELRGRRRMHKTPGQQEVEACLHWLEAEIAALRPQAIVALGATAAHGLLGRPLSITANAGRWLARADGTPVLVCLHPAALLRADASRRGEMQARWLDTLRVASEFAHAPLA